ncbi:MAG: hypothetical protein OEW58_03795 [Gammaproteobacteria bacterium]|nr:hypothetical protein [Gammaproteobacteria bacterium]
MNFLFPRSSYLIGAYFPLKIYFYAPYGYAAMWGGWCCCQRFFKTCMWEMTGMVLSDDVKGYMAFFVFLFALPMLYLAPTILNAIIDLSGKF